MPASVTARTPAEAHAALDFVLAPQLPVQPQYQAWPVNAVRLINLSGQAGR